jgi:hypothetical protein
MQIIGNRNFEFMHLLGISILLSIPAIFFTDNIILFLPAIIIILLSFIFGERFIMAVILISLFTLVGEFNRSLRIFIQLIDFSLLGILYLKMFGLSFSHYKQIPKSIIYFLLLYFSSMVISAIMSQYPSAAIGVIFRQFAFFLVVFVFYSLIKSESDVKDYFISIIIVACIFTAVFVAMFLNEGYDLLSIVSKTRVRITALTGNIEAATNFFVISFPLIISFLLLKNKMLLKSVGWTILIFCIIGLLLAMSRSAFLAIAISTSIIFFMLKRKIFYRFLYSLGVVILLIILYEPLNEVITLLFRIEEGVSVRDQLWLMTVNIINDFPVFGLGPGVYKYELFNYYPFMLNDFTGKVFIYFADVSEGVNLAHNIFLVFFSEMGILGLITIISLPIIYFRIGIKVIQKYKNGSVENYCLIIALFAAGASVFFRNIINSIGILYIGGIHTDLPFWLVFSSLVYFYIKPINTETSKNHHQNLFTNFK